MLPGKIIRNIYRQSSLPVITLLLLFTAACSHKLELKDLKDIHKVGVMGIDSIYYISVGDTLHIHPQLQGGEGDLNDTTRYEISWAYYSGNSTFTKIVSPNFEFVATDQFIGEKPWYFRITNRQTGLFTQQQFQVSTFAPTTEGWYVLCDAGNNQSRLDMLSYNPTGAFTAVPDVITKMGSTYELKGKPRSVDYTVSYLNFSFEATTVVTDQQAVLLNPSSLKEHSQLSDAFPATANFTPATFTGVFSLYASALNVNGVIYYSGAEYTGDAKGPLSRSAADGTLLKASPLMAVNEDYYITQSANVIAFDSDLQAFFLISGFGGRAPVSVPLGEGSLFNFQIHKKLVALLSTSYNGGEYYAVLQDNTAANYYLAIFNSKGQQRYLGQLKGAGISATTHFAVSAEFGYLFYNAGSQVYEFDPITNANTMVADLGTKAISYLSAPKFPLAIAFAEQRIQDLSRKLMIATYEEGNLSNSGIIGIYDIPAANKPLILKEAHSGFGKVVSTSYKQLL